MFDFSKIGELAERIETGLNDLDSRLEQIANQQKIGNGLLAAVVADLIASSDIDATPEQRQQIEDVFTSAFGERARRPFAPTSVDLPEPIPAVEHQPSCVAVWINAPDVGPFNAPSMELPHSAFVECDCWCHKPVPADVDPVIP